MTFFFYSIKRPSSVLALFFLVLAGPVSGQTQDDLPSVQKLKKMSMEELMDIEVTSVSKKKEKLTEVASAIQVITQEDIRRSAATSLPEALRLAPNLQVSQINSSAWIVSARGFNGIFPNKMLVMIDGRTVYSPLFAGVFWDAQSVLLEDVERIEVISGPGGTVWGANAVNGIINIITKSASKTKGLYASIAKGTFLNNQEAIRYGGNIGSKFFYRAFVQHSDRNNTYFPNGKDYTDKWGYTQSGFNMSWDPSDVNAFTLQGNFYGGLIRTAPSNSGIDGQNVLGKWTHKFSDKSELIVQGYYDRTWRRDIPSTISDQLNTYDLDFQHRFPIGQKHNIIWGGGYRYMQDFSQNSTLFVGFVPASRNMDLFSAFFQDEITLASKLKFTLGTKLQHNVFSGFEIQPSGRLAWTPNERNTLWSAVSRAVRMPSRIDVDYYIPTFPVPAGSPHVAGGPNFTSEKVVAYELGYRVQPSSKLSFSLATYYNQYNDLYSVEALPGTLTYEIQNGVKGNSWGAEISGTGQINQRWKLRGGYNYFVKKLQDKPGHSYDPSSLGYDTQNQISLQSILNLPGNFQFDVTMRYVDKLSGIAIPDYFTFDARLAWVFKQLEISVIGQNLRENRHLEYIQAIPRSIYGKIVCRF